MMTPRILGSVILALMLIVGAANAQVRPPISVDFDEFGVGTVRNGTTTVPLPLASPVPTDPFLISVDAPTPIVYDLTALGSVTDGDIDVYEGQFNLTLPSDVLRFYQSDLFVYSDKDDGVLAPADVGIPEELQNNQAQLFLEQGPPTGPNGLFGYVPVPGDAGFSSAFAITYNFTSDLPEPALLPLIALCAIAPFRRWRVPNSLSHVRGGEGRGEGLRLSLMD
jgi:hypothetical protein